MQHTTRHRPATAASKGAPAVDRLDARIALACLVTVTLFSSLGKFGLFGMDGNATTGSLASQIGWGTAYVVAAWRLVVHRERAALVAKRTWPVTAFLALAILSVGWSVDGSVTLRNAGELAGVTIFCYYVVARFTLAEFLDLAVTYFAGVCIVSLLLVFLWPSHGRSSYGVVGWCGLFEEKNGFGAAMGMAALTFGIAFGAAAGRRRASLGVATLVALVMLAGSQSVTASLVFVGSVLVTVTLVLCASPRFGGPARVAAVVVALGAVTFVAASGIDSSTFFGLVGKNENLTGRADFWPGLLAAIADRPFLGFGYNAFFQSEATVHHYIVTNGWWYPIHAHNSFYQLALSVGFVGVAIYSCAIVSAFASSVVRVVRDRRVAAAWPFAIIAFVLLGSFTETYFGFPNLLSNVMFTLALIYPHRDVPARVRRALRQPVAVRPTQRAQAVNV